MKMQIWRTTTITIQNYPIKPSDSILAGLEQNRCYQLFTSIATHIMELIPFSQPNIKQALIPGPFGGV